MNEFLASFLISLGAGLVPTLFQQQSDKTIEERLENYFREALWEWTSANEDRKTQYSIDSYRDLLSYLNKDGKPQDTELEELIVLWQKKLMADQGTSAILTNLKLDKANCKLTDVSDRLISVDGKVDNIGEKIDNVHFKIDSIFGKEKNIVDIPDEKISFEIFRNKKDMEHIQNLMEAFSYDLLANFCLEDPDYIDYDVVCCCDVWEAAFINPLYCFYDKDLDRVVRNFFNRWSELIKLGAMHYFLEGNCNKLKFGGLRGDMFISDEYERIYNQLLAKRQALYPYLNEMIAYIRDHYVIDLEAIAMNSFRP